MEYRRALLSDTEQITELVQNTIGTVYPKYYSKEAVNFFCSLHCKERILEDVKQGSVWVLMENNKIIGTGSCEKNHITRVYVLPQYQRRGYGSYIMQKLEEVIAQNYKKAVLDASLPACRMYEKRGYRTAEHRQWPLENDVVLVYEVMEKACT